MMPYGMSFFHYAINGIYTPPPDLEQKFPIATRRENILDRTHTTSQRTPADIKTLGERRANNSVVSQRCRELDQKQ
jgi:hypothetical protein